MKHVQTRNAAEIARAALESLNAGNTLKSVKLAIEDSGLAAEFTDALAKGRKADFAKAINLKLNDLHKTESQKVPSLYIYANFDPAVLRYGLMELDPKFKNLLAVDYLSALYNAYFREAKALVKAEYPHALFDFKIADPGVPAIIVTGCPQADKDKIKELIQLAWDCGDWPQTTPEPVTA